MAIHVGVYLNFNRNTAIVVRVKEHIVWYLTMQSGAIDLRKVSESKFAHEWTIHMPSYPAVRAIRTYARSELSRSEEAKKVMSLALANERARARQ